MKIEKGAKNDRTKAKYVSGEAGVPDTFSAADERAKQRSGDGENGERAELAHTRREAAKAYASGDEEGAPDTVRSKDTVSYTSSDDDGPPFATHANADSNKRDASGVDGGPHLIRTNSAEKFATGERRDPGYVSSDGNDR